MQTARATQVIIPNVEPQDTSVRWFSANGCVVNATDIVEVYVGTTLIGNYDPKDKIARDVILVGLSQDRNIKKGKLAAAFGLGAERLRVLNRKAETQGLAAIFQRTETRGRKTKVTPTVRRKLYRLFDAGESVRDALEDYGCEAGLSHTVVGRVRKQWAAKRSPAPVQLRLDAKAPEQEPSFLGPDGVEPDETRLHCDAVQASSTLQNGRQVQHVGGWLLLAVVHALGLHMAMASQWKAKKRLGQRLRVAVDAVVLALGLGQRCVEGVRRLQTPSAAVLLRTKNNNAPSASWTRRVLKDYVDKTTPFWLHMTMMQMYLERAQRHDRGPAVFYVDNHMRPYTGKYTVRKGWRMQDKHVRPGATDYYVHDEDGRPVYRFEAPSHDSLTKWLSPVTMFLRAALGEDQRILLVFDRAGAFPKQLMELRHNNFEFVTYERRPYPLLSATAFDERVVVQKRGESEVIGVHESRQKNLGKGRGRVRRIALRMADGHQVNLLAVSKEPKERLIELMLGRWVQENGFKHANERWGINQLDGRQVEPYPPQTIIPNPARRRLELALRAARVREGDARRLLARPDTTDARRAKAEQDLADAIAMQQELETQRPHVPKHAPLEETELKGKLVYHPAAYKTVLDTIRIAAANAEAELAAVLAPKLRRPTEAKKALANLFAAPGAVRVNDKSITVTLSPAGTADEQYAFEALFDVVNRWNLTLPGDDKCRSLRFRSQLS